MGNQFLLYFKKVVQFDLPTFFVAKRSGADIKIRRYDEL